MLIQMGSSLSASPDPRTCRHNLLPSTGGSRAEEADLLPAPEAPALLSPFYFGLQKERQSHKCMETFPASTSSLIPICKCITNSLPWCLRQSSLYGRTESSFQKMKEGSVFPGLMASEGKGGKPAEHCLSMGMSFAGLAGEAGCYQVCRDLSDSLLSLGRAFKLNYLISGKAFSGQPELFVVKLVSDIWAKKGCQKNQMKKSKPVCVTTIKIPNENKTLGFFIVF